MTDEVVEVKRKRGRPRKFGDRKWFDFYTTVAVKKETMEKLKRLKLKGKTLDEIIVASIEVVEYLGKELGVPNANPIEVRAIVRNSAKEKNKG